MATAQVNESERHGDSTGQAPSVNIPKEAVMIPSEGRKLLEEYSNIAPVEVIKHVTAVVNIPPQVLCCGNSYHHIFPKDEE